MLRKRIIPCLDVHAGRVVKGVQFVDLTDEGDPVELAARYVAEGADEICFLDITASHEERETMLDVIRRTAQNVFVPLTVGGGVRSVADMRAVLRAGADKVTVGGGGADISPMKPLGVPQIGIRQDTTRYFDYHHTEADTLDKVDRKSLDRNVAAMMLLAYALAEMEATLPRYEEPSEHP